MSLILKEKLTGPTAWRGEDLRNDDSWMIYLSSETINVIDAALAEVKARGLSFPNFTKDDFLIHAIGE